MTSKITLLGKYKGVNYMVAVALCLLALFLSIVLEPFVIQGPFIFFMGAVTLSAWFGGLGPGLLTILLSIILIDYFVFEPLHVPLGNPSDYAQLLVFGSVAFLICWIENHRRESQLALRQTRDELAAILNGVSNGITTQDATGRVIYANEFAAIHNGFPSAHAMIHMPISDLHQRYELFDMDGNPVDYTSMPRFHVFRTGEKSSLTLRQHFVDTGENKWITLTTSPIKDEIGQVRLVVNVFRDISERYEIERLQRENASFLQQLLDSLPIFVGQLSTEGKLLQVSKMALDLAGLVSDEVIGKHFDMTYWWSYSPEVQSKLRKMIAKAASGEFVRHDMKMRVGTDAFRTIDFMISAMRDADGNITRLIPAAVDVTQHRERENKIVSLTYQLKEEKKRLNNIISNIPGIVFEGFGSSEDSRQNIEFVSDYVEKMLGYMPEEWAKNPYFFRDCIHPEDLEYTINRTLDIYNSVGAGIVQFRLITKDGSIIHVESRSNVVTDENGSPIGVYGVIMDVTESKQMEAQLSQYAILLETQRQRLANTITNVPGIVYDISIDPETTHHQVQFISDYAEEMLGYTPAMWKENPDFWQETVVHPDDRRKFQRQVIMPTDNDHSRKVQFRCICKDGSVVHVEARFTLFQQKAEWRSFGVITDITERKVIERQLESYMQELHRSNEELEQFAYVASHDLQEPLRKIRSYLQLIERRYHDQLDDDGKEFIGYAVEGAARMRALISDLLTYSRVTRVKRNLGELSVVNLNDILAIVFNTLQLRIQDTNANIVHDKMPTINANERQMIQLFQNLLSNAIKYRQKGVPPKIHISVQTCEEGWCFNVSDNGIGIDPEQQKRIFAVFQRLHTRTAYQGTGIGLAICKRVVENHDGRIWVESQSGEGATFYFTLPSMTDTLEQTDETNTNPTG